MKIIRNHRFAGSLAFLALCVCGVGEAKAADTGIPTPIPVPTSPAAPTPQIAPVLPTLASAPTTSLLEAPTTTSPTTVSALTIMTAPSTLSVPTTRIEQVVDHMSLGRAAIAKSDWTLAVTEFTAAVKANGKDADANNLLAYSYRKSGNLTNAFKYYAVALAINPAHEGALEYQGEAFVMAGKAKQAKANLAKLKAAGCATSCRSYQELAAFIAKPMTKKSY